MHYRHPIPDVRPLAALKTRAWLAQGKLAEAWGWINERGLSADDNLNYMREFEHLTLARVLIAQYKNNQDENAIRAAMGLLERLLVKAEEGKRLGSIIEILVLQALTGEAQGNIPLALKPLKRALTLAEPESYVRVFVDEGSPMASLLRAVLQEGVSVSYTTQLLTAIGKDSGDTAATQPLIDPLSERELEILALIADGLKNQEIADKMIISINTVLYHTKNMYNKLGVNKRTQAVLKARELNLL
jgi:LuxR family maltose regulon positive regulatory protein